MKLAKVSLVAGMLAGAAVLWSLDQVTLTTALALAPAQIQASRAESAVNTVLPNLESAIDSLALAPNQKRSADLVVKDYRQAETQARIQMIHKMNKVLDPRQFDELNRKVGLSAHSAANASGSPASDSKATSQVQVTFSGGYETDPRDHGRPVVLVAGALGVSSDVFREAFSGVTPSASGRQPEPVQVRRNKQALLRVLSPYGVTNDRLDEVSNYYRYVPGRGELWPHTPAAAIATIRDGSVVGFTVTDPGSGYSSSPRASLGSMPDLKLQVDLGFGANFKANGSVKAISIKPAEKPFN
jgi:hypothetical protein